MRARGYPSSKPGAACGRACERLLPLPPPCPFARVLRGANERRVQEVPGRAYVVLSQGVYPVSGAKPAGIMPCKGPGWRGIRRDPWNEENPPFFPTMDTMDVPWGLRGRGIRPDGAGCIDRLRGREAVSSRVHE